MRILLAYAIGIVFGLGIMVSGMADPAKVLNFFDVFGNWDPSLAFVMAGAVVVAFVGYRILFRAAKRPVFDRRFHVPVSTTIDRRLVGGAAIFGLGWGIAGFCPGGALPGAGTLNAGVLVFIAALIAGIVTSRAWLQRKSAAQRRENRVATHAEGRR